MVTFETPQETLPPRGMGYALQATQSAQDYLDSLRISQATKSLIATVWAIKKCFQKRAVQPSKVIINIILAVPAVLACWCSPSP